MAGKLRPLLLPGLVERKRQMEGEAQRGRAYSDAEFDLPYNAYSADLCSPEATSPVTSTFSSRGYYMSSSSTSSLELTTPASSECPSSPAQPSHPPSAGRLPDVQEEPVGTHEMEHGTPQNHFDLYSCLCSDPCIHNETDLAQSSTEFYVQPHDMDIDYDLGFLSDSDFAYGSRTIKKRRSPNDSSFMGLGQRLGSRIGSFAKRRSSMKNSTIIDSPSSDFGFEHRSYLSGAASSRSSSLSATGRRVPDRANEPPLPPTPALSFYESSESVALPDEFDDEESDKARQSIERDRAMATTPLLPPLMTALPIGQATAHPSPLESPSIANPFNSEPQSPRIMSPALSTKPSTSSFHIPASAELPPIPAPDAWSDRLGHANFTILPAPYRPVIFSLDTLQKLQADWEAARVNYAKHLARTGEHYGVTSKTYKLTEEKWANIKRSWREHYDEVVDALTAGGAPVELARFDEGVATVVPIMDSEGKFPERGDEDIVGPMAREAVMNPGLNTAKPTNFWRSLLGLKK